MIGTRCKVCGEPITSALGCDSCRSKAEEAWEEYMDNWESDEDFTEEQMEREQEESEEEYGFE